MIHLKGKDEICLIVRGHFLAQSISLSLSIQTVRLNISNGMVVIYLFLEVIPQGLDLIIWMVNEYGQSMLAQRIQRKNSTTHTLKYIIFKLQTNDHALEMQR